jgi:hypothetical protein
VLEFAEILFDLRDSFALTILWFRQLAVPNATSLRPDFEKNIKPKKKAPDFAGALSDSRDRSN